jgi:hypothetical protein
MAKWKAAIDADPEYKPADLFTYGPNEDGDLCFYTNNRRLVGVIKKRDLSFLIHRASGVLCK